MTFISLRKVRVFVPGLVVFGVAFLLIAGGCGKKEDASQTGSDAKVPSNAGMPTPDAQGNIPGISKPKDDPVGPK